jgi:3-methyladenine DNA glycosylase AlkC
MVSKTDNKADADIFASNGIPNIANEIKKNHIPMALKTITISRKRTSNIRAGPFFETADAL